MTLESLRQWREGMIALHEGSGKPMIAGLPRFWCDGLGYVCADGHVSHDFLSGDGPMCCRECGSPVVNVPDVVRESTVQYLFEGPRYWTPALDETGVMAFVDNIFKPRGEHERPAVAAIRFDKNVLFWTVKRGAAVLTVLCIEKFDKQPWGGWTIKLIRSPV